MSNKEKTPILLRLKTISKQEMEEEITELALSGVFYLDHTTGSRYLHYEEEQEAGTIRTVLKITDQEVLLMRSGAVNMRMHFFRERKRSTVSVDYGVGKLMMESELLNMEEVYVQEAGFSGKINFQYELLDRGVNIGIFDVSMILEEDKG
ncbi:DUF1934 domain-containing protein [Listeria rocourtiae]|uniref:DUF1934 domain-containing protein n=1 Tax=Listeria rocourtiae TaxID=647910 RepID=UPI003D2F8857